jgi:hypothetical protein
MARRADARKGEADAGKVVVEKAADFRSIRAEGGIPIGTPSDVTIIFTRAEPGVLVQTLGEVVSEREGSQDVNVTANDVSPIHVQAAHIVLSHQRAAELAGNLLRLVEALDSQLFKATLSAHNLRTSQSSDAGS